jgi:hypothetical protein
MKRVIAIAAVLVMTLSLATPSYAENLSGGIYGISDANFTLPAKTEIIFGSNSAEVIKSVMRIPDEFSKNSTLWHAVEEIKITFYIDRINTPLSADFSGLFTQGVMQLGEGAGNAWADSDNNPGYVSVAPRTENGLDLTQEYTLIFRPRAFMDLYNAGENGGAVLLGLKVGNMGNDSLSLGIRFTDMAIYGEPDVIARFRANAKATAPAPTEVMTGTPDNAQNLQGTQSSPAAAQGTESETVTTPPVTSEQGTTYVHTDYVSVPFSLNQSVRETAPYGVSPETSPTRTAVHTTRTTASVKAVTATEEPESEKYFTQASEPDTKLRDSGEISPDTGISATETLISLGVFAALAIIASVLALVTHKK